MADFWEGLGVLDQQPAAPPQGDEWWQGLGTLDAPQTPEPELLDPTFGGRYVATQPSAEERALLIHAGRIDPYRLSMLPLPDVSAVAPPERPKYAGVPYEQLPLDEQQKVEQQAIDSTLDSGGDLTTYSRLHQVSEAKFDAIRNSPEFRQAEQDRASWQRMAALTPEERAQLPPWVVVDLNTAAGYRGRTPTEQIAAERDANSRRLAAGEISSDVHRQNEVALAKREASLGELTKRLGRTPTTHEVSVQQEADSRGAIAGSLPVRFIETAGKGLATSAVSLLGGIESAALNAIGATSLANMAADVRQQAQGTSQRQQDVQAALDTQGLLGGTFTSWLRQGGATVAESAAMGLMGGIPALATWYGATTADDQLAQGADPRTAMTHGLIEGGFTMLGGKVLGAGAARLAGRVGGWPLSADAAGAVAKWATQRYPVAEPIAKVLAAAGSEVGEEFLTEASHYMVDVAGDRDEWSWPRFWERTKGVIGPSLVAGGLGEAGVAALESNARELYDQLDARKRAVEAQSQDAIGAGALFRHSTIIPAAHFRHTATSPSATTQELAIATPVDVAALDRPELVAKAKELGITKTKGLSTTRLRERVASQLPQPTAEQTESKFAAQDQAREENLWLIRSGVSGQVQPPAEPPAAPAPRRVQEGEKYHAYTADGKRQYAQLPHLVAGQNAGASMAMVPELRRWIPVLTREMIDETSGRSMPGVYEHSLLPVGEQPGKGSSTLDRIRSQQVTPEEIESIAAAKLADPNLPGHERNEYRKVQDWIKNPKNRAWYTQNVLPQPSQAVTPPATAPVTSPAVSPGATSAPTPAVTTATPQSAATPVPAANATTPAPGKQTTRPTINAELFRQQIHAAATTPAEADALIALANANAQYLGQTLDEWAAQNIAGVELTDQKTSRHLKQDAADGTPADSQPFKAVPVDRSLAYQEIAQKPIGKLSNHELEQLFLRAPDKPTRRAALGELRGRKLAVPQRGRPGNKRSFTSEPERGFLRPDDSQVDINLESVHQTLLGAGATLESTSDSGSRYYALPDGGKARVSDHPPNAATFQWMDRNDVADIRTDSRRAVEQAARLVAGDTPAIKAWHWSPYRFDEFTTEHIGAGEGSQSRGWGLYFADLRQVSEYYKELLSNGLTPTIDSLRKYFTPGRTVSSWSGSDEVVSFQDSGDGRWHVTVKKILHENPDGTRQYDRPRSHSTLPEVKAVRDAGIDPGVGALYAVTVKPTRDELLDWDKPISEQSNKVRVAIEQLPVGLREQWKGAGTWDQASGRELYRALANALARRGDEQLDNTSDTVERKDKAASLALLASGIRGIKFKDKLSRGKEGGTQNYVIFDGADVVIEDVLSQTSGRIARGEAQFLEDGRAIIRSFRKSRNISTLAHELGHVFRRTLLPTELASAERSLGVKDGKWTRASEERFARMFERYLRDGKAPTKTLRSVFEQFKDWLTKVYRQLAGTPLGGEIPADLRDVFDVMLGATYAQLAEQGGDTSFEFGGAARPPATKAETRRAKRIIKKMAADGWLNEETASFLATLPAEVLEYVDSTKRFAEESADITGHHGQDVLNDLQSIFGYPKGSGRKVNGVLEWAKRVRKVADHKKGLPGDYTSIPGFVDRARQLEAEGNTYYALAAEASARGGGDMAAGLFDILKGDLREFRETKAERQDKIDRQIAHALQVLYEEHQQNAGQTAVETDAAVLGVEGDWDVAGEGGSAGRAGSPQVEGPDEAFQLDRSAASGTAPFASTPTQQPDLVPDLWRGSLEGQQGLFEDEPDTLQQENVGQSRKLANVATTPREREWLETIDMLATEAGEPGRRAEAQVNAEAAARLAADRDAERTHVLATAQLGGQLGDTDTVIAKKLFQDEAYAALESGDTRKIAEAVAFRDAYRATGTLQARAFRMRRDPLGGKSLVEAEPRERLAAIIDEIFERPAAEQKRRKKAVRDGNTKRIRDLDRKWANKLAKIEMQLASIGISLKDLPKVAQDPVTTARVRGQVSAANKTFWDKLFEFRSSLGLFSGPATHLANIGGNAAYGVWDFVVQAPTEATINEVMRLMGHGDPAGRRLGEVVYLWRGIRRGVTEGLCNALVSWKTEQPVSVVSEKYDTPNVAIGGTWGRIVRAPGYRALTAEDEFFNSLFSNIEVGGVAFRTGTLRGLRGRQLEQFIDSEVRNPQSLSWLLAVKHAEELTFHQELSGSGQKVLDAAMSLRRVPLMRWFMPIVSFPIKSTATALRKAPVTGDIAMLLKAYDNYREGKPATLGMSKRFAERALAWGVVAAIAATLDDDDPWITGSSSQNPGLPPLSIRLGGRWFSYARLEPFATVLGPIVDGIHTVRGGSPEQLASAVVDIPASQIASKTMLQGLSDLFSVLPLSAEAKQQNAIDRVARYAVRFGESFVPNIYRQAMGAGRTSRDQTKVWGTTTGEKLRMAGERFVEGAGLPGVEREARIDPWGRPLPRGGAPFWSAPLTDYVYRLVSPVYTAPDQPTRGDLLVARWNAHHPDEQKTLGVPLPYFVYNGKRYALTSAEYEHFQIEAGTLADKLVGQIKYQDNPSVAVMKRLDKAIENAREVTRKKMMGGWRKRIKAGAV